MEPNRPAKRDLMTGIAEILQKAEVTGYIVNNPVGSVRSRQKDPRLASLSFNYYEKFKCTISPADVVKNPRLYAGYGRRVLADYLGQGSDKKLKGVPPLLVCYDFSGVVIGALRSAQALRLAAANPGITRLELFHAGIEKESDHAFVVVNRSPVSSPTDLKTWGDDAFIIDAWYAAQRDTAEKAGSCPVKDITSGSEFFDPDYLKWLASEPLTVTADGF
jgi:hypothetical protein